MPADVPRELVITVCDQGEGFEVEEVADPLAPENMLKSSGRGIFFMRSFMDDVRLRRRPEGGMEVRLVPIALAASSRSASSQAGIRPRWSAKRTAAGRLVP